VPALIAKAKAAPGQLNYGSTGVGSGSHLAMELFMVRAGARMQHVPFGGAAQMVGEIVAERLDVALAVLPAVVGLIESKSVVALAVAAHERAPQLPDVPPLAQTGVADAEAESWIGLFVDSRVPDTIVAQMSGYVRRALSRPAIKARVEALGMSLALRTSDEFRVFQAREIARWGEVIQIVGLKPE
jgi:tripartite-type tricarboxylate transporter receptor subunit TctC